MKGDPRINRTIPGPGQPPLWWKYQLARHEESTIGLIAGAIAEGHRRLKDRRKKVQGLRRVHLAAAQDVLDRLHGKPTQPVEVVPRVDLSHLTDKELDDFNRLLARVLPGDGSDGTRRSR